jgi:fatty-acyl-CoA synthase
VPTVWQGLLQHLRDTGGRLDFLEKVVIGGSAPPEALVRAFEDDYGVKMNHAWGMTELSPFGTQTAPTGAVAALDSETQLKFRLKQGRPPLGMDMKLVGEAGERLPHDGEAVGRLKVKGPYVVREYFRGEGGALLDPEGFFDTGDMATIDAYGYMQITDRAKDVIKSGGEWISSIEIENLAMGHPKVLLAAVIGVAHPKWDERPLLLVKPKPGESVSRAEMLAFLAGKIARWWTPDEVLSVEDIPLGATGKIDKKILRERYKDYVLPDEPSALQADEAPTEEAAAGAGTPFPTEAAAPERPRATGVLASLAMFAAGLALSALMRRR